jgi:hypothetical protein
MDSGPVTLELRLNAKDYLAGYAGHVSGWQVCGLPLDELDRDDLVGLVGLLTSAKMRKAGEEAEDVGLSALRVSFQKTAP